MLFSDVASHLKLEFFGEDLEIDSMNELDLSSSTQLSFALHKKYASKLSSSKAKAYLITSALLEDLPQNSSHIVCEDVSISMAHATKLFNKKPIEPQLLPAKIGRNSYVDSMAKVENGGRDKRRHGEAGADFERRCGG